MRITPVEPLRFINTPTYIYDEAHHLQFRQLLGLSSKNQILKREKDTGRVFKATLEECLEHELPIGEHINEGIWRSGAHRLSIVDIRVTRNVLVDIECKENPAYAWRVGERLFAVSRKRRLLARTRSWATPNMASTSILVSHPFLVIRHLKRLQ
jgi:hypothetical protein